jgi:hypothetical protein
MKKGVERDIKDAKEDLKRAKEDGEADAEVEAMTKISELQIKGREIEKGAESNKEPVKRAAKTGNTPAAQRWIDRNRWFNNDAQFKNEIGYSRVIDSEMGAEAEWKGKVGTSEYFAELDKRIHERIPALRVRIKKAYGGKKVSRIAPVGRGTIIKKKKGKGVISLTKEERASAAEFGIKGKDLEEYARQVHKREAAEAKGGQ